MRRTLIDLFVLTALIYFLVTLFSSYMFNLNWIGSLLLLTAPAMIAGVLQGRRTGQQVSSDFAWKVAIISGLIFAFIFSVFFVFIVGTPGAAYEVGVISGATFGLFVLSLVGIRLVYRWGVKFGARNSPKAITPEIFD